MSETGAVRRGLDNASRKSRPGEIISASSIKEGSELILYGLDGAIARSVTVIEGVHVSKARPSLGPVVVLQINYSQKEIDKMAVRPQTRMVLPLRDIGVKIGRRTPIKTSLWLARPEEPLKSS